MPDPYTPVDRAEVEAILASVFTDASILDPVGTAATRILDLIERKAREAVRSTTRPSDLVRAPRLGWFGILADANGDELGTGKRAVLAPRGSGGRLTLHRESLPANGVVECVVFYEAEAGGVPVLGLDLGHAVRIGGADEFCVDVNVVREAVS